MNQHSELTQENDVTMNTTDHSRQIENGSAAGELTTADIANGSKPSASRSQSTSTFGS